MYYTTNLFLFKNFVNLSTFLCNQLNFMYLKIFCLSPEWQRIQGTKCLRTPALGIVSCSFWFFHFIWEAFTWWFNRSQHIKGDSNMGQSLPGDWPHEAWDNISHVPPHLQDSPPPTDKSWLLVACICILSLILRLLQNHLPFRQRENLGPSPGSFTH